MCETNDEEIFSCPNNSEVSCHPGKRNCAACGWHPDVAMVRLVKICNEMGIELPAFLKEE